MIMKMIWYDYFGACYISILFSDKPTVTTHAQLSQQQNLHTTMGTKRGRFLMRQPRIKRESDPIQSSDNEPSTIQYLTIPHVRVERQCSDPLPAATPPSESLLSVPSMLVKQHSHPLLPSQVQESVSSILWKINIFFSIW